MSFGHRLRALRRDRDLTQAQLAERRPRTTGWFVFAMLERIREYAHEHFDTIGEAQLRDRHARYFAALAQRTPGALRGPEQFTWLNELAKQGDDLRNALAWALREKTGAPLQPAEESRYAMMINTAREQMEPTTWAAAWSTGRTTALEDVLAPILEHSGWRQAVSG